MDRASKTIKAIKLINSVTQYSPMISYLSCTTSLPGKEIKKKNKLLNKFIKAFNSSIIFCGKTYSMFKSKFGVFPKVLDDVRWYLEWEQVNEMDQVGVEIYMNNLIPEALEKKISERSVQKMIKVATKENMPKIIVETAVVSETGISFCVSTYLLEGDDPLGLDGYIDFLSLKLTLTPDQILIGIVQQENTVNKQQIFIQG